MSISGGLDRAIFRGKERGCQVIQIFTRNASRWRSKALSQGEIDAFLAVRQETSVEPVAAHNSYLINLASPRVPVRKKSFQALLAEMERAERLNIPYLVMHPGSHLGDGEEIGLGRIRKALNRICHQTPSYRLKILLETTAGQGSNLGYRFEHLARIIEGMEMPGRLGVCLDTCHVFAAGYDFRTEEAYQDLIKKLDAEIGLEYLKLLHINDSKNGLGSRIDRHEHLGCGLIGKEAFSFFLKDPIFKDTPFLLETPKGEDENGRDWDMRNLELMRCLLEE
jgi:deoxyribonuclease-4